MESWNYGRREQGVLIEELSCVEGKPKFRTVGQLRPEVELDQHGCGHWIAVITSDAKSRSV